MTVYDNDLIAGGFFTRAGGKTTFNIAAWNKPAPDSDADACHVPHAFVTEIDGRKWLYLFYATQIRYSKNDGTVGIKNMVRKTSLHSKGSTSK